MTLTEDMADWEIVSSRAVRDGDVELVRSPSGRDWGVRIMWYWDGSVEVTKHVTKEIATDQFWKL